MGWEMVTTSEPVARKAYHCEASEWIDNSGWGEGDYSPEDWALIEKARAENFEIKPGTQYVKVQGKWEGDFTVFRARKDLDHICHEYELYDYGV